MIIFTVFLLMCFRHSIVSAAIYGVEVAVLGQWWNNYYFLKFNSPGGKVFYIDIIHGTMHREKEGTSLTFIPPPVVEPPLENEISPFISFVSIDLKIYDIYFENDLPNIEESKFTYDHKYELIRHRLDSFVGPNKKMYKIIYNKENDSNIVFLEKSEENLQHFQIITFGPYEKWQHTYDFSENGELLTDHCKSIIETIFIDPETKDIDKNETLSPIKVLPNRSIWLPEMEPNSFLKEGTIELFIKFNTPSGKQYQLTNLLDIVQIRNDNDEKSSDDPYLTFTEPNGRTYDIYFRNDDHGYHPLMVKGEYRKCYYQCPILYSFVGPNGIMYRIDHKIRGNNEIPVLVAKKRKYSDLQITAVTPQTYHNKYIKYVFSNNGSQLFYRASKIDWTPLNKQPSAPIDVVAAGSERIAFPFLSFYSPSGKNYHIITNETEFSIVVEEGINTTNASYISFSQKNGKKYHIIYLPGVHPYIEEDANPVEIKKHLSLSLVSFVTPDRKKYSIEWTRENETKWKPNIELPSQAKDPIDEKTRWIIYNNWV